MNILHLTMPVKNSAILTELYDYMNYADIILTCSDSDTNQKPVAHKLVLSSCSHFLKELLEINLDSHELIIPDVSTNTMIRILQLLYTGEVRVESQEEISDVVEGIQLLGINSVVNSIQFSPEPCQSIVDVEDQLNQLGHEEIQQNWPSSELISPISLEDHSSTYWTDSNDAAASLGIEVAEGWTTNSKDLIQVSQPPLSQIQSNVIAKEETRMGVNSQVQDPIKKKKKVKRGLKRPKVPISNTATDQKKIIIVHDQDPSNLDRINAPILPDLDLNSSKVSKQFKTDINDANFMPVFANEFNDLVFLNGHNDEGYGFELCDNEQMKILCEETLQNVALQDHSYASHRTPKI